MIVTLLAIVNDDAVGTLVNTATVSAPKEVNLSNNTDTVSNLVQPKIDLAITKTDSRDPVEPGSTFSYTLDIVNNGPSDATGVVVTDDRPEFATPEAVPSADEHIVCALSELPSRTRIDQDSYVLLTTRGMPVDVEGLPALVETSAAYIGVIGSRRRWEVCVGKLRDNGMSDDAIARITSPIGLELNAESPEEIAVSIMAEIIMLRRKGAGERMQYEP